MSVSSEQLDLLTDALLQAADRDSDGAISLEELTIQFEKYPSLVSSLSTRYVQLRTQNSELRTQKLLIEPLNYKTNKIINQIIMSMVNQTGTVITLFLSNVHCIYNEQIRAGSGGEILHQLFGMR